MKTSSQKIISRGLDGTLSPDERRELERLRESDPSVRQTEQAWMALGDQIRSMPVEPPDATLAWQDIRRAIRQQETGPGAESYRFFGRLKWAGAFAGLVLAVVMGMYARQLLQSREIALGAVDQFPVNRVEWVVAEIPGATTMIYTDTETDLTVIWMDVAQNADPRDT